MRRFNQHQARILQYKSLLYIGLSLGAGVTNYLYFPIAKHFLGLTDFGKVAIYMAIIAIFGSLLISQQLFAIGTLGEQSHAKQVKSMATIRNKALYMCLVFMLGFVFIGLPILHWLDSFDIVTVAGLMCYFLLMSITNLLSSYWHANNHLLKVALFMSATSVIQLIFEVVLLSIVPRTSMVVISLLLGQVTTLIVAIWASKTVRLFIFEKISLVFSTSEKKRMLLAIVPIFGLYVFLNIDVIIARATLKPETGGYYATHASLMKILFFLTVPIVGSFLPRIATHTGSVLHALLKRLTLIITATLGLAWLAGMPFYPLILRTLYDVRPQIHLYYWLLPAVLSLTYIYIIIFTHAIHAQTRESLQIISLVLLAVGIAVVALPKNVVIAPSALTIGGVVGLIISYRFYSRKLKKTLLD